MTELQLMRWRAQPRPAGSGRAGCDGPRQLVIQRPTCFPVNGGLSVLSRFRSIVVLAMVAAVGCSHDNDIPEYADRTQTDPGHIPMPEPTPEERRNNALESDITFFNASFRTPLSDKAVRTLRHVLSAPPRVYRDDTITVGTHPLGYLRIDGKTYLWNPGLLMLPIAVGDTLAWRHSLVTEMERSWEDSGYAASHEALQKVISTIENYEVGRTLE